MRTFTPSTKIRNLEKQEQAAWARYLNINKKLATSYTGELNSFFGRHFSDGLTPETVMNLDARITEGKGFFMISRVRRFVQTFPGVYLVGSTKLNIAKKAVRQYQLGVGFNKGTPFLEQLGILEFLPYVRTATDGTQTLAVLSDDRTTYVVLDVTDRTNVLLLKHDSETDVMLESDSFPTVISALQHIYDNVNGSEIVRIFDVSIANEVVENIEKDTVETEVPATEEVAVVTENTVTTAEVVPASTIVPTPLTEVEGQIPQGQGVHDLDFEDIFKNM